MIRGSEERLSPILMTALATGLALVPLAWAGNKPGHEIEHPMAIVILGGLVTSTVLNLVLMPALYLAFGKAGSRAEDEEAEAADAAEGKVGDIGDWAAQAAGPVPTGPCRSTPARRVIRRSLRRSARDFPSQSRASRRRSGRLSSSREPCRALDDAVGSTGTSARWISRGAPDVPIDDRRKLPVVGQVPERLL